MTKAQLKNFAKQSRDTQARMFKCARINLGVTQKVLAEMLEDYGYIGAANTVATWEQGVNKVPVMVYELVKECFAERSK